MRASNVISYIRGHKNAKKRPKMGVFGVKMGVFGVFLGVNVTTKRGYLCAGVF